MSIFFHFAIELNRKLEQAILSCKNWENKLKNAEYSGIVRGCEASKNREFPLFHAHSINYT